MVYFLQLVAPNNKNITMKKMLGFYKYMFRIVDAHKIECIIKWVFAVKQSHTWNLFISENAYFTLNSDSEIALHQFWIKTSCSALIISKATIIWPGPPDLRFGKFLRLCDIFLDLHFYLILIWLRSYLVFIMTAIRNGIWHNMLKT